MHEWQFPKWLPGLNFDGRVMHKAFQTNAASERSAWLRVSGFLAIINSKLQVFQTSKPEGIALLIADGFLHGLDWAHNPVQPCYCCAFAHHHRRFCRCVRLSWSVAV